MPCCCAHTTGGVNDTGRSNMVHLLVPELPPSALAGDQATSRHRRMDRFCVRARAPSPVRRRGDQAQGATHTVPGSSKRQSNGTVMRAPTSTPRQCRGRPSSKSVHNCPRQLHRSETRGGVMRVDVISCRRLQDKNLRSYGAFDHLRVVKRWQ